MIMPILKAFYSTASNYLSVQRFVSVMINLIFIVDLCESNFLFLMSR